MQQLDVAELLVGRRIGAMAVVDQFAVLDGPVLREVGPLLREVCFLLLARQLLDNAVRVQPVPSRQISAVKDRAKPTRRGRLRGTADGRHREPDDGDAEEHGPAEKISHGFAPIDRHRANRARLSKMLRDSVRRFSSTPSFGHPFGVAPELRESAEHASVTTPWFGRPAALPRSRPLAPGWSATRPSPSRETDSLCDQRLRPRSSSWTFPMIFSSSVGAQGAGWVRLYRIASVAS